MVIKLSDNVYSPLGTTTLANYEAVLSGRSTLRPYTLPNGASYMASLFPEEQRQDGDLTFFERLCIASASDAIARSGIDASSPKVRFFLSTTKGNVHLLDRRNRQRYDADRQLLASAASVVSRHFGNPHPPVVVSNACISGLSAQIAAMRSVEAGVCDVAVVIGCEVHSEFIVSGFQTLHALSSDECRPFDKDRCGLNLGEAAATIVLASDARCQGTKDRRWVVTGGVMCNDANHISGPSRTGEGSYRCLQALDIDKEATAFVSVHGTSTVYNDEMESIAIDRAGLAQVPIFSLKGNYGHTMGAAGVLETILSMQAVEHGVVFGTRGFHALGVSRKVNVSERHTTTDKHCFVKLMSGFGGCNAAMSFAWEDGDKPLEREGGSLGLADVAEGMHAVSLTPDRVSVDHRALPHQGKGHELLLELYRNQMGDYPKFFKMDELARTGFIASELLLKVSPKSDYNILLFNSVSSLADDIAFQKTIDDKENFFPSPALFVYTLPNIVTGEIAIRNRFQTETNFMVLDKGETVDCLVMGEQAALSAQRGPVLTGWVDCWDKDRFHAVMLAVPKGTDAATITKELVKNINPMQ
ncbi:MAG: 3-oxoacyl-ACP synthase [Bacteroidales bacterium]|nr:3-oxoacyl-ACP synthase [Bacteroidales bacterium]